MDFAAIQYIHFIGIGGAGMAPMARIFHDKRFTVSGSDLTTSSNTKQLTELGIAICIGHDAANLPEQDCLVVFSSAVSPSNPEMMEARRRNLTCLRRGEALAYLAQTYQRPVAISGSHGKTTVTAMLSHILKQTMPKPGFMVGGKVLNWDSASATGDGDVFVTEVDESDGTHAAMECKLGLVTNVEDDHCWSVGGPEQLDLNFRTFAKQAKQLVYFDTEKTNQLFALHADATVLSPERPTFTWFTRADSDGWGDYQCRNALQAVEAAIVLGITRQAAEQALNDFPGVARRMTIHYQDAELLIIEDYAHHPTEVAAAIDTLQRNYPEYHLSVVFQPHRYARLARYIDGFARELRKADDIVITPVFAAWTETGSVNSEDLATMIGPKARFAEMDDNLAGSLLSSLSGKTVLAILGAGDIDTLIPQLVSAL